VLFPRPTLDAGTNVEMIEQIVFQRCEADDAAIQFRNEDSARAG
jgi:hypothetical protein